MTRLSLDNLRVSVPDAEFLRLLQVPPDHRLEGRAAQLQDDAREWFAANARPWSVAVDLELLEIGQQLITSRDAPAITSAVLAQRLRNLGAHRVLLVAVSAGPEVDTRIDTAWQDGEPDLAFTLNAYASGVVEQLVLAVGARLCEWSEPQGMGVAPHYSPGYPGWSVQEHCSLVPFLHPVLAGPLRCLDSGQLVPKKSQVALFGVTRHLDRLAARDATPCTGCSLQGCAYRRASFAGGSQPLDERVAAWPAGDQPPQYSIPVKALRRWAANNLLLEPQADGSCRARFRYDGTGCTNMGSPASFTFDVLVGPKEAGHPILASTCGPTPGDTGTRATCKYVEEGEAFLERVAREAPLLGAPLRDALHWEPKLRYSGCLCVVADRNHKWRVALQAIHFGITTQ